MNPEETKLDELNEGDGVHYNGTDWYVSARDVYKESSDYLEAQWTFLAPGQPESYLVRSAEETASGLKYVWVFTQAISFNAVEYQTPQGEWKVFRVDEYYPTPPAVLKYSSTLFSFHGQTSGLARDDEGDMIPKMTWDYYDPSGMRNLAIEIWKEEGIDYPEAYLGLVVTPEMFSILPPGSVKPVAPRVNRAALSNIMGGLHSFPLVGILAFVGFCLWSGGIAFDKIVAAIVPFICLLLFFQAHQVGRLLAFLGNSFFILIVILVLGDKISFGILAVVALLSPFIVQRLIAVIFPDGDEGPHLGLSFTSIFIPLWVYSLYNYFQFAPGPHNIAQFYCAVGLPAALAFFSAILNYFFARYGQTKTGN